MAAINGTTIAFAFPLHHWTNQPTVCPCPPAAGSVARWNGIDINDVRILRNTIQIPTQFAQYLYDLTGINTGSKGYWEIKSGNNIWVEGNIFRGWFSSLTVTVANQTGAAPWTTIDNLTIRNNLIEAFTLPFIITGGGYHLAAESKNARVENNLVYGPPNLAGEAGFSSMGYVGFLRNATFRHNTVINSHGSKLILGLAPNYGLTFKDNIFFHNLRGLQCAYGNNSTDCWPDLIVDKNVFINNLPEEGGISLEQRYPNSYIVSNSNQTYLANPTNPVGWVDPASGNYALGATSPYKNQASDGTDPGVNMAQLQAALAGNIPPPPTPTPSPSPTPIATPTPTPHTHADANSPDRPKREEG